MRLEHFSLSPMYHQPGPFRGVRVHQKEKILNCQIARVVQRSVLFHLCMLIGYLWSVTLILAVHSPPNPSIQTYPTPHTHDLWWQGHSTEKQLELDVNSRSYPLKKTAPSGSPLGRAPPSRCQWDEPHEHPAEVSAPRAPWPRGDRRLIQNDARTWWHMCGFGTGTRWRHSADQTKQQQTQVWKFPQIKQKTTTTTTKTNTWNHLKSKGGGGGNYCWFCPLS